MTDKKEAADKEIVTRSVVGSTISDVKLRPEDVTKTKMRKFCFRQPNQQIAIFSLTNNVGQEFELEIDEATVRAMVAVFKGKKPKVKKELATGEATDSQQVPNGEESTETGQEDAPS